MQYLMEFKLDPPGTKKQIKKTLDQIFGREIYIRRDWSFSDYTKQSWKCTLTYKQDTFTIIIGDIGLSHCQPYSANLNEFSAKDHRPITNTSNV